MIMKSSLLGGAALGVLLAATMTVTAQAKTTKHHHHAAAAAGPSDMAEKVDTLTATVSALEQRLNDQTTAQQATEQRAEAAEAKADAAEADAQAAHEQLQTQIATIPGEVETAVASNTKPSDGKMHWKGITITPGGFLAAEGVYRTNSLDSDIGSPAFGKIPFDNNAVSHAQETRFSARQSRLSLLAQGDIDQNTQAAFYTEVDFLGAAQTANSNESNSFNLRIRNLYGTIDWNDTGWHLLAGQSWSLATMNTKGISPRNEDVVPTIDAQYIPGFVWARQPQIRITKDFADKQVWVALSLENPQTTFTGSTAAGVVALDGAAGSSLVTSSNPAGPTGTAASSLLTNIDTFSLNHIPDVIGKIAFEPEIGGARPVHLELFGVLRDYYDRINIGTNSLGYAQGISNADVTGGGVGGGAVVNVVPKILDLQGSFLTGQGIGRYGSGGLPDVTLMPNGRIAPIPETMFLVGGTLHATPALDLYVFGGQEQDTGKAFYAGGKFFGYGNPYYVNAGCGTEVLNTTSALTCTGNVKTVNQITAGLWDKAYNGSYGFVRIGVQYSHTELDAFPGELTASTSKPGTYAPTTSDDMLFFSFRYYPF